MDTTAKGQLSLVAAEYFFRADAGRADVMNLFTDDVEIYFPKFGIGRGKAAFGELATGLLGALRSMAHYRDRISYIESGTTVVCEGFTHGATKSGVAWEGGKTPGGRFCSVFEFRGEMIARMYIYLDPDYAGADHERFLWGTGPERIW